MQAGGLSCISLYISWDMLGQWLNCFWKLGPCLLISMDPENEPCWDGTSWYGSAYVFGHGSVSYWPTVMGQLNTKTRFCLTIILSEAEQLPYHCIPLYTIAMFLEHASGVEQLDAKDQHWHQSALSLCLWRGSDIDRISGILANGRRVWFKYCYPLVL